MRLVLCTVSFCVWCVEYIPSPASAPELPQGALSPGALHEVTHIWTFESASVYSCYSISVLRTNAVA